jgi:hypothetical protein
MCRIFTVLLALSLATSGRAADEAKPNTLTPKEIADGWILLFDGETTFGWKIDGEAKVKDGVLVVGGTEAATASIATRFGMDFQLQFDFLNSGTTCKLKGGIYNGRAKDIESNLRLAEGISDTQWHRCRIQTKYREGNFETRTDIDPVSGGGHSGAQAGGMPCEPFHCAIGFEVPKANRLSVRNIKLRLNNMKPLFNGKDLAGWKKFEADPKRAKSQFGVTKDGWLTIKDGPGDLQTEGAWADFVLQLDCRTNGDGLNSGVFFRCIPGQYQNGYEAQINNKHAAKPKSYSIDEYDPENHQLRGKKKIDNWSADYGTGAIYRRVPARLSAAKDREWFTMTVVARGRHIATWVNGIQVVDWDDNRPLHENPRNGCRLEKGPISLQGHDPTTDLNFRNIHLAELTTKAE